MHFPPIKPALLIAHDEGKFTNSCYLVPRLVLDQLFLTTDSHNISRLRNICDNYFFSLRKWKGSCITLAQSSVVRESHFISLL